MGASSQRSAQWGLVVASPLALGGDGSSNSRPAGISATPQCLQSAEDEPSLSREVSFDRTRASGAGGLGAMNGGPSVHAPRAHADDMNGHQQPAAAMSNPEASVRWWTRAGPLVFPTLISRPH